MSGEHAEPAEGHVVRHDLGRRRERRRSSITASRPRPTAGCRRVSCSWSIPAPNIRMAPPTSPARSRSAQRPGEQRAFFTLVLKGMIAISMARFPEGTRGCDLDPLARIALWKAGRRLRSWHRPRRRLVSLRPRRAAADLPPVDAGTAAGHDLVERAGLLPARQFRHSHREPDLCRATPRRSTAATWPMLGFETLTYLPDRPQPCGHRAADARGVALAQRLSLPHPRGADAADPRRGRSSLAGKRDACRSAIERRLISTAQMPPGHDDGPAGDQHRRRARSAGRRRARWPAPP